MHIKINKTKSKKGIIKYAKIVEAYFDKERGYSRQNIIFNYVRINSDEDLLKCQQILQEYEKGNEFVNLNDFNLETKSYGIYYTVSQLVEKYNLDKILKSNLSKSKHLFDVYSIIQALIINRLKIHLVKIKLLITLKKIILKKLIV